VSIGPAEIVIVLIIALLVFGPKRLPQMGKSLGKGVREFKKAAETAKSELGLSEVTDQINEVKGTFSDLKSSVDVKAAIEAPVQGKDAATGAAAGAALAGASAQAAASPAPATPEVLPGPVTPAAPGSETPVAEAEPEAAAAEHEAPEAPEPPAAVEAPDAPPEAPDDALTAGTSTGA
jgi:TatA/E family protein of Tat protein translocase